MFPVTTKEGSWAPSPPAVAVQQWTPALHLSSVVCISSLHGLWKECAKRCSSGFRVKWTEQWFQILLRAGWRQLWGWQGSLLGWCSSSLAGGPQCLPHIQQCWEGTNCCSLSLSYYSPASTPHYFLTPVSSTCLPSSSVMHADHEVHSFTRAVQESVQKGNNMCKNYFRGEGPS